MSKTRRYDYRERGGVENHMKKRGKKIAVRELQEEEEEFDPQAWSEYNYEDDEEEGDYSW